MRERREREQWGQGSLGIVEQGEDGNRGTNVPNMDVPGGRMCTKTSKDSGDAWMHSTTHTVKRMFNIHIYPYPIML